MIMIQNQELTVVVLSLMSSSSACLMNIRYDIVDVAEHYMSSGFLAFSGHENGARNVTCQRKEISKKNGAKSSNFKRRYPTCQRKKNDSFFFVNEQLKRPKKPIKNNSIPEG